MNLTCSKKTCLGWKHAFTHHCNMNPFVRVYILRTACKLMHFLFIHVHVCPAGQYCQNPDSGGVENLNKEPPDFKSSTLDHSASPPTLTSLKKKTYPVTQTVLIMFANWHLSEAETLLTIVTYISGPNGIYILDIDKLLFHLALHYPCNSLTLHNNIMPQKKCWNKPVQIKGENRFLYKFLLGHIVKYGYHAIHWNRIISHTENSIKSGGNKCYPWFTHCLGKCLVFHSQASNLQNKEKKRKYFWKHKNHCDIYSHYHHLWTAGLSNILCFMQLCGYSTMQILVASCA